MISPTLEARYLRDPLPVRLGGLAADLARIASCADEPRDRRSVESLLNESKHFAEWAAMDAPFDVQVVLLEVQRCVARWHRCWLAGLTPPELQEQARQWADRLLELSGLAC